MEKYELVDAKGNKTGKILTSEEIYYIDNIPDGCYISVVGVVIINDKNEVLLQKRSKFKKFNPNKWGVCGGKVNLGETPIDTGIRETQEEIGVVLNKNEFNFLVMDIDKKFHFIVYYIRKNIDLNECKLQEKELEKVKYFKIEEIINLDMEGLEWLENLKKVVSNNLD